MTKTGRNDPCPCGSGKKFKHCCIDKRPREQFVYIGYKEPFEGITAKDGQVFVHLGSGEKAKADFVFSQTQHTRESGKDKVISSISDSVVIDLPLFIAEQFDALFAIDTNTRQIGDDWVSVASILECYPRRKNATQVEFPHRKHGNMCFRNCPNGDSEKYALFKLINIITSSPKYNSNLRIAIITDYNLGGHIKYNKGELPLYKDFYLPTNFTVLYASSDKKDNVLNTFITMCDKDAKTLLRELDEKGYIPNSNPPIPSIEAIPDLSNR